MNYINSFRLKIMKIQKLLFSFLIVFAFSLLAFGQVAQPQTELAKYIQDNYTKREVMITMRDGVKLFTAIYEPKAKTEKYPILLNRTPYTVSPYGADKFRGALGPSELYAREGYIFVYQDVRGRWMSEGQFEDVRPDIDNTDKTKIDESTDTYDTIDWLIKNVDNNNGRVGTYGISYPGFYTSAGSIDSHPALKACSPQAPVSDWFHGDDMHHNGALFLAQNFSFFSFFGQERPVPTSDGTNYLKPWKGRQTQDGYDLFLNTGGLKEIADYYEKSLGVRIKFWDEMMAHPNYDQFWKDRNILPKLKNITCATMTVGGWYDNEDLFGALQTYQHIEKQNPNTFNVLVIGPWDHGGWSRNDGDWLGTAYFEQKTGKYYRENLELPFFNHFLKDKGDMSKVKEVNLFDTGSHEWKSFENYSPTTSKETALYLNANGKLTFEMPTTKGADEYVSDPANPVPYRPRPIEATYDPRGSGWGTWLVEDQRFVNGRPDVLSWETDSLTEDVVITGHVLANLFASTTGSDSDWIVKLIDVYPEEYAKEPKMGGYQLMVANDVLRGRFRQSFARPQAIPPNKIKAYQIDLHHLNHRFQVGHKIMVQVQSSWFPIIDRNPQKYVENIFTAKEADYVKATQRVWRAKTSSSHLLVPVAPNR